MAETLKIKDLPLESRPREAFMRSANPQKEMSDATLLAILIRTGQKGSSAIDLAMLHRIGICRNLILQQTGNHLDVLDDPAFLRYKKYFD